nr:M1 family metallopeptidase [Spirilliplanes yamanashiensis]
MTRRGAVAGVAAAAVVLAGGCTSGDGEAPPEPARSFAPGAAGAGDPYFPGYGNGGYDVASYDLKLGYDPATDELSGTATVTATALADLSQFNLDLAGLDVSRVTINGVAGSRTRAEGNELIVTPPTGLPKDREFVAEITYAGKPGQLGTAALGQGGWLHTGDGAIALGEPESASTWFPVNDHPSDKAAFRLEITVPEGLEALSNGVPGERSTAGGSTTWRWEEKTPMAPYLATLVIGQYRVETGTHKGRPVVTAIPESLPADGPAARSMAETTRIADHLETVFGPYPVDAYGGVVVTDQRISYALETQSRPVYGNTFFRGGENLSVVAHELAHQWFGDSVSVRQWKDIWLNEGFATYAEWLWSEHEGEATAQQRFTDTYAGFDWSVPTGDPGQANLFGPAVYQRGGMTVHALRRTVGDEDFFAILKAWTAEKRNGNAATAEFVTLAERVSGESLRTMFDAWLFGTTAPPVPR